eukprot:TRINITY_DN3013_c0_g1_i1.p1 TRINITY_DN3013_c0_g1~~TRINITY_DN3013_c0_g1_i1.p1  ORF type:complete len:164 (+),score=39.43 TRINITY_DN3013_c0_g1_i1:50-493(+)
MGWTMQDESKVPKRLLVPDMNAPPPTAEECKKWKAFLARVERFYSEGADKQLVQKKQIQEELDLYKLHQDRVKAQYDALGKYPPDLTRRKLFEKDLEREGTRLTIEVNARERALDKLDVLNQKRSELVSTMRFLQSTFDEHCAKITK